MSLHRQVNWISAKQNLIMILLLAPLSDIFLRYAAVFEIERGKSLISVKLFWLYDESIYDSFVDKDVRAVKGAKRSLASNEKALNAEKLWAIHVTDENPAARYFTILSWQACNLF